MGDPPPDPETPPHQPSSRRSSQASQRRSWELSQPQPTISEEGPEIPLDDPVLQSGQGILASETNLQGWSPGAALTQQENLMFQAEEGQLGGVEYPSLNMGFPSELQPQPYLEEGGIQATRNASLMLQQLQQGQGNLFQQLDSAYLDTQPGFLGQFSMYQGEDLQFHQGAPHGPYMRDDPALQYSPSELGIMPFSMEVPEPEPRELAVQNAKAYLLQTSVSCSLSL